MTSDAAWFSSTTMTTWSGAVKERVEVEADDEEGADDGAAALPERVAPVVVTVVAVAALPADEGEPWPAPEHPPTATIKPATASGMNPDNLAIGSRYSPTSRTRARQPA